MRRQAFLRNIRQNCIRLSNVIIERVVAHGIVWLTIGEVLFMIYIFIWVINLHRRLINSTLPTILLLLAATFGINWISSSFHSNIFKSTQIYRSVHSILILNSLLLLLLYLIPHFWWHYHVFSGIFINFSWFLS